MIRNAITRLTLNPRTNKWQRAQWLPNWGGKLNNWAVRFPSQRGEVDPKTTLLKTKNG